LIRWKTEGGNEKKQSSKASDDMAVFLDVSHTHFSVRFLRASWIPSTAFHEVLIFNLAAIHTLPIIFEAIFILQDPVYHQATHPGL
jgi:hypothetical protein